MISREGEVLSVLPMALVEVSRGVPGENSRNCCRFAAVLAVLSPPTMSQFKLNSIVLLGNRVLKFWTKTAEPSSPCSSPAQAAKTMVASHEPPAQTRGG